MNVENKRNWALLAWLVISSAAAVWFGGLALVMIAQDGATLEEALVLGLAAATAVNAGLLDRVRRKGGA